ncbi:Type 1 phosphatases regulator YPI1 [Erysiphe neolycopersici]|uniref:Type 1 phosphatases regulator n=1 Tax=Erysiphe neolycopersici TaxID=212602 RepID=A0A420HHC5_9PEZI|nr:Type 1 phosphatases regulator YPI1 [Erysiphe neolycopersici]
MVSPVTTLTLRDGEFTPVVPRTQNSLQQHQQQQQQRMRSNIESSTTITKTMNDSNVEMSVTTPVLRLRGISANPNSNSNNNDRRIQWDETVINNEGMNKKKSKVCCIYHAPRGFGESSEESSSSDDSTDSSDASGDLRTNDKSYIPRSTHSSKAKRKSHRGHQHKCNGDQMDESMNQRNTKQRSPNAYEKLPKPRNLR